jgi:MFS family permease
LNWKKRANRLSNEQPAIGYLERLRHLSRPARLYLVHAALLTISLAISSLFFNLLITALGYPLTFLGLLNTVSISVAALLSVPLWWLAAKIGLRVALIVSAALYSVGALVLALWPEPWLLVIYSALSGISAVLFQVSAPPFMMRHSDAESRDHLFTTNTAINVGLAGLGSLVAGGLPGMFAAWLGVAAEHALAYRATFLVTALGLLLALIPLLLIDDRVPQEAAPVSEEEQVIAAAETPAEPLHGPFAGWLTALLERIKPLQRLPAFWLRILADPWPIIQLLIPPLLISFGAALLIPYLNLFIKQRFAVPDTTLGAIFAALNISIGVAALLGPLISVRIGKVNTIVLTQALSIPFLLTMGFAPVLAIVIGAAMARAALFNMASPLYDAFAMERTEESARPTVIGLINGAYSVGYLVAPTISTRTQEAYGFTPLFLATTCCYVLAVLANTLFFVRRRAR